MYAVDPDDPNAPTLSQIPAWSESPSGGGREFEEQTAHIGRVQIPGEVIETSYESQFVD